MGSDFSFELFGGADAIVSRFFRMYVIIDACTILKLINTYGE